MSNDFSSCCPASYSVRIRHKVISVFGIVLQPLVSYCWSNTSLCFLFLTQTTADSNYNFILNLFFQAYGQLLYSSFILASGVCVTQSSTPTSLWKHNTRCKDYSLFIGTYHSTLCVRRRDNPDGIWFCLFYIHKLQGRKERRKGNDNGLPLLYYYLTESPPPP